MSISLTTDRPADSFSAAGLPDGLSLDSLNGLITGAPTNVGNYQSIIQATNQSGSLPNNITFQVIDFSGYPFGLNIVLYGYSGCSTIYDFLIFVVLNASIDGFSYEQFASPYGHDLRFLSADASEELIYEVVDWNPAGTSAFWVLIPELNSTPRYKQSGEIPIGIPSPPTVRMGPYKKVPWCLAHG